MKLIHCKCCDKYWYKDRNGNLTGLQNKPTTDDEISKRRLERSLSSIENYIRVPY